MAKICVCMAELAGRQAVLCSRVKKNSFRFQSVLHRTPRFSRVAYHHQRAKQHPHVWAVNAATSVWNEHTLLGIIRQRHPATFSQRMIHKAIDCIYTASEHTVQLEHRIHSRASERTERAGVLFCDINSAYMVVSRTLDYY